MGLVVGVGGFPASGSPVGIAHSVPAAMGAAGGAATWPEAGLRWQDTARFAEAGVPVARRRNADHDLAARDAARGEVRRLQELLPPAQSACGGNQYIGAEPDIEMQVYRLKFMQAGGRVCWADMDARTGRVIAVRK